MHASAKLPIQGEHPLDVCTPEFRHARMQACMHACVQASRGGEGQNAGEEERAYLNVLAAQQVWQGGLQVGRGTKMLLKLAWPAGACTLLHQSPGLDLHFLPTFSRIDPEPWLLFPVLPEFAAPWVPRLFLYKT
eukprot:363466-Chlamydomonas_euryale.AAC.5